MFRKLLATAALTIAVSGLAGCSMGVSASPSTAVSNKIAVTFEDYKFDPMTWTVAAGKPVEVSIKNVGQQPHEWVLIKKGTQVTVPWGDDDEDKVFWETEAGPGESKSETFTAPTEPGQYEIVCGTPAHIELGMKGTLVVK